MEILDTDGMFDLAAAYPEQVDDAVKRARESLTELPPGEKIEQVLAVGLGGSGIAGDVLASVSSAQVPVPVLTHKSYECPGWVSESTLVFAISVSGDTEETLEATSEAALAGANIVAVTQGGQLARLASEWGAPIVEIPKDITWPRAALGAAAIPLFVALARMGLFKGADHWMRSATEQLRRRRDELVAGGTASSAAEIARRLGSTVPMIHGAAGLGAAAALRWKNQFNENAKSPAFVAAQPELCHNDICAWGKEGIDGRELFSLVALRHDGEHPQVEARFKLIEELMMPVVSEVIEVRGEGEGDLAQLLDLMYVGDFVSLWLAAERGVDPGPVPVLAEIKARLAGTGRPLPPARPGSQRVH